MGDIADLYDYAIWGPEDFEPRGLPDVYWEMVEAVELHPLTEIDRSLLVRFERWAARGSGDPWLHLYLTEVRNELQRRLTMPPALDTLIAPPFGG